MSYMPLVSKRKCYNSLIHSSEVAFVGSASKDSHDYNHVIMLTVISISLRFLLPFNASP